MKKKNQYYNNIDSIINKAINNEPIKVTTENFNNLIIQKAKSLNESINEMLKKIDDI